jgi:heptosyltransferase-2
MERGKKILVVRTDRLGDVVLTTPVFKALREACPDACITVLVKPDTAGALRGNPHINEVIIYDKDGEYKSVLANIRFAMWLRRQKFDLAIVLDPAKRTHALVYLAGIPRRIGYDEDFGFLLTDRIKNTRHEGKKHESEYNLELLEVLGIAAKDATPRIFMEDGAAAVVDRLLLKNKVGDGRFVLIHPGASCPSKVWPAQNFAEAADSLSGRYGVKIVVFSGSDSAGISCAEDVKRHMTREAVFLTAGLDLSQRIALIKRAALLISSDSGPVHLAVALQTPVVAIFGRNQPGLSPRRWGPLGERDITLHKDVGCQVCLAHDCRLGFRCLIAITPDEVVEAAGKVLEKV